MDELTFECPKCGAQVYPEQTRCPECGHNMYPEDEQASPQDEPEASRLGAAVGGILIGWMIASGISLIVHFIMAGFIATTMLGNFGKLVLFTGALIGSIVGGYVSGTVVKRDYILLGAMVGLFSLPVSALLATRWVEVTTSLLLHPTWLAAGVLIVVAGIAGGWLNLSLSQSGEWREKWRVRGWEDLLYQDLLRKVRFNGSAADRLIEYERKQDPQAPRLKLIQNAIERWERDNR